MDLPRSAREPDFDANVNVLGTIRLLENHVRYGVGKVVFASTGELWADAPRWDSPKDSRVPPTLRRSLRPAK
jgi:nucleoside-diphosphate-sugar epimerase